MPIPQNYKEFILNYPALQSIGETPLIKLNLPIDGIDSDLYAKQEHASGSSVVIRFPFLLILSHWE